jgi:hypothetical protein
MATSRAQQAAKAIAMKKASIKPKSLKKAEKGTSVKNDGPPDSTKVKNLKEVTITGKKKTLADKFYKGFDNVFRKTYPFNVPYDTTVKGMKKVDDAVESVGRGYTKLKNKVKKHLGVHQAGGAAKSVPKGYHVMPNGKLMKNSAHKKTKKKG